LIETCITAAIGATVSILDAGGLPYIRLARMWFVAFFLAVFLSDDVINAMQHFFSFKVSVGGTVFMTALFGSAITERFLFFIKSFKLSTLGYKR
jgi:hypothetical protein